MTTSLNAASVSISNPFNKLPWNVCKERNREAGCIQLKRARLHRELIISENALWEEIVIVTDALILKAGDDLKQKIKVKVAKDKALKNQTQWTIDRSRAAK
jgi:hypothetical protein